MNQWFRMYSEFASDPKCQSMDETLQRRFIMFLCLQCSGEFERLDDEELAFALRISTDDLERTKQVFSKKGLLKDGKIANWNKRQYKSDSSTERVRAHRERSSNGDETLQKRPQSQIQITDTDTDTDSEKKPTVGRKATPPDVPPEFDQVRQRYPKRAGSQPWPNALRAIRARLGEGHTWQELIAGVDRYAAFVRATGKERTEIVLQAATFFGPSKRFLEEFTLPASKAEIQQSQNVDASLRWLESQETVDAA